MIATPPVFASLSPEMKARLDRFRDEHAGDPVGAQPHLLLRLLGGEVQRAAAPLGDAPHDLQEQRGLADAWLAHHDGDPAPAGLAGGERGTEQVSFVDPSDEG